MYEDIGKKIKSLATTVFVVEAIAAIISGIVLMAEDSDMILLGLLIIVLGPMVAWVSSWLLYGFGELIDKVCDIESRLRTRETETPSIPVSTISSPSEARRAQAATASWKCSCGRVHPAYVSSCSCGQNKSTVVSVVKDAAPPPVRTANGWKCSCGREHASYVSSCPCGVSKSEIK